MAKKTKDISLCSKTYIKGTKTCYIRDGVLGQGAFGTVFRGIHQGEEVAVKRLELQRLDPKDREIKLQTQLIHENILKILTVEKDDDFRYIVLELCAGTLEDVIAKKYNGPPLPSDEQVMRQICDGLNYMHSQNMIHLDIKPENILIDKSSQIIKVSDFGLSKQISIRGTCSMSGPKGTYEWMAPELREGNETRATPKSDVFPCGCTFFVFLARKNGKIHPFGDRNKIEDNIRQGNPVNIESLPHNLSGEIKIIIRGMIECDPIKRMSLKKVKERLHNLLFKNGSKSTNEDLNGSNSFLLKSANYMNENGTRCQAFCKKTNSTTEAEKVVNKETRRKLDHVKNLDVEKDSKKIIEMELCDESLKEYDKEKFNGISKNLLDEKDSLNEVINDSRKRPREPFWNPKIPLSKRMPGNVC